MRVSNSLIPKSLRIAAASLLIGSAPIPTATAQTSLFNDGTDSGWTRYDPIAAALGQANGATGNTWTFQNGGYRLTAAASPNPAQLGPGRSGSLRTDTTYSQFCVSVDILPGWDLVADQAFGLLARVPPNSMGPGTTDGYAFTYQTDGRDIQISRLTNEDPTAVSEVVAVTLEPTKSYRMLFIGDGSDFKGYIFELPNIVTPIVAVSGSDPTYTSGHLGLVVYDNGGNAGANALFDNYAAGSLAQPTLALSAVGSELTFSWPLSAMHHVLQRSTSLAQNDWEDVIDGSVFLDGITGRQALTTEPTVNFPHRFFRLRPR